jgi:Secretion system C-terminal sorting domain
VVLPTSANDTVAILDKRTGTSNTAWEKWSDNSWNSMKVAWGNVRNYNLAILPIIECGPAGYRTSTILSDAINIFPNPSTGNFNVVTTFATAQNIDVKVYNILGQIIYSDKKKEMSTGNTEINLSDQTSGIYFVELTAGQEKITKRILIDK